MATATGTHYTPEDLLQITDRPTPELIGGELVERPGMGQEAADIACAIIALLKNFSRAQRPGFLTSSEGGFQIFPDDPGKVRFPDATFTSAERLPGGRPAKGHSRTVPDLVVEVISPNDLADPLRGKVRDFLDAGVPLIWVVNPGTRDVEVIRADRTARYLTDAQELDGEDVLPGFRCRVAEFFE